jgi:hypothetical protein
VYKPGPSFVKPQFPANPVVGLDPATSDPIERFAWWRGMPVLYFYLRRVLRSKLASLSLGHTPLEFDVPNIIAPTPGARNKNQSQFQPLVETAAVSTRRANIGILLTNTELRQLRVGVGRITDAEDSRASLLIRPSQRGLEGVGHLPLCPLDVLLLPKPQQLLLRSFGCQGLGLLSRPSNEAVRGRTSPWSMPKLPHIVERNVDGIGSCTQPFSVAADTPNISSFKPAVAGAHPDAGRNAWPACHGRRMASPPRSRHWLAAHENLGLGLRGRWRGVMTANHGTRRDLLEGRILLPSRQARLMLSIAGTLSTGS